MFYADLWQPQKSLDYLNQAIATERQWGSLCSVATDYDNLSITYLDLGENAEALGAFNKASAAAVKDGFEIDSLSMIAQQRDAEAVLATLWSVNNMSTSQLMSDFYARWVGAPTAEKAEALRQAQLAFLHAVPKSQSTGQSSGYA